MKVGLITYHSAYNFGSVLQAYATQESIKKICGECEIINYRTKEQKRIYSIFVWNKGLKGLKSLVKNVLQIPSYKQKKNRVEKYERIFENLFYLTKECSEPEDVYNLWNKYDVIIAGSDQIWNKHSNELNHVSWDYMYPYLLHGYKGKKISYASSLTNMADEEIKYIIPDISKFDSISFREKETCKKINQKFKLNAVNVLDPTFLLEKKEWIEKVKISKKQEDKYVLYYSLGSFKEINEDIKTLIKYGEEKNVKIKIVTPLNFAIGKKNVEILESVDPIEFLELIYNATTIITDSYHGTILSVNLEKDIYSICKGKPSDFRKKDILSRISLENRIINRLDLLLKNKYQDIDYNEVNKKIDELKKISINYLEKALNGGVNERK